MTLADILESRDEELWALPEPTHPRASSYSPPALSASATNSEKHKLQGTIEKGHRLLQGEDGAREGAGEDDPQSSSVSSLSSQSWPELMNLREQSCLLFVILRFSS